MVLDRVQRRGGEDAELSHAAAEHLAVTARGGDALLGRNERAAHGCAEALRETHADGVERRGELTLGEAAGDGRVPEPSAVEVEAEAFAAGERGDAERGLVGGDAPSPAVVRVLDDDE